MKLLLEIEVEYSLEDGTPIPESLVQALEANLQWIADHAANRGLMTGETEAEVDEWSARITRI